MTYNLSNKVLLLSISAALLMSCSSTVDPDSELISCTDLELDGFKILDSINIGFKVSKHDQNPIITGRLPDKGNQFYPASIVAVDDTVYAVAKAGGSELWGYYSIDGVNWIPNPKEERLQGVAPDHEAVVMRYDSDVGLFHLFAFKRNLPITSDQQGFVMHYTAAHPFGIWQQTEQPVLTTSDFTDQDLIENESDFWGVEISDVIKINNRYFYYGRLNGLEPHHTAFFIGQGTRLGERITPRNIPFGVNEQKQIDYEGDGALQGVHIMRLSLNSNDTDKFLFMYTWGYGRLSDTPFNHRRVYLSIGNAHDDFRPSGTLFMVPDSSLSWERERNYLSTFLKSQDGEYLNPDTRFTDDQVVRIYYSGSNHFETINTGQTGLAEAEFVSCM